MDDLTQNKKDPEIIDAKTVVLDRNELTELMTSPAHEYRPVFDKDLELEEILREAHSYDISDTVFQSKSETKTAPVYRPSPEPVPEAKVQPAVSETAKRIIEEKAEEQKNKKKKRIVIICIAAVAVLALLLVAVLLIINSGQKRDYSEEYNSAQLFYYDGKYDDALSHLRNAMSIEKTDECLLLMSQCYEAKLDFVNAISILESSNSGSEIIKKRIDKLKAAKEEYEGGQSVLICGEQFDVNATVIDLSAHQLRSSGLGDLAKLPELTSLKLSDNSIDDLSALAVLKKLVSLDLSDNDISNIGPIRELTQLRTLHLDGNKKINDFTPLYGLGSLTMLTITGIEITENQLAELKSRLPGCIIYNDEASIDVIEIEIGGKKVKSDVTKLNLSGCGIVDLSPLSICTSLTELDLSGNYIKDLSPLIDIPGLVVLDVSENALTDIRPLMSMTTIQHLNLAGNQISSITALNKLTELQELVINGNPLVGTQSLESLAKLKILGLKNTGILDTDLQNLYKLKALRKLALEDNPELTESGVEALKEKLPDCAVSHSELLKLIELGGEKFAPDSENVVAKQLGISDISAVTGFIKLKSLDLSGNVITDIEPLASLTTLETLDLSDNNIEDASPLYVLTRLQKLSIGQNSLSDEQIQELIEKLPDCTISVE